MEGTQDHQDFTVSIHSQVVWYLHWCWLIVALYIYHIGNLANVRFIEETDKTKQNKNPPRNQVFINTPSCPLAPLAHSYLVLTLGDLLPDSNVHVSTLASTGQMHKNNLRGK